MYELSFFFPFFFSELENMRSPNHTHTHTTGDVEEHPISALSRLPLFNSIYIDKCEQFRRRHTATKGMRREL